MHVIVHVISAFGLNLLALFSWPLCMHLCMNLCAKKTKRIRKKIRLQKNISENGEKFLAVLEKLDQLMVPKINDDADRNEAKLEGEKIYD